MLMGRGTLDRRVETRRLPLDRMVGWLPRDDAFYLLAAVMPSARAEPVVVTRDALLQVERHLREPGGVRGCGLLHGAICVCPRTGISYLCIDGAVRAVMAVTDDEPHAAAVVVLLRALGDAVVGSQRRMWLWAAAAATTIVLLWAIWRVIGW
jgi:hypothetical protein